jgi:hypothetical protein
MIQKVTMVLSKKRTKEIYGNLAFLVAPEPHPVRLIAMQRPPTLHIRHDPTHLSLIAVLIVQKYVLQDVRE